MDFGIKPWIFKAHDLTQYSMTFNQALKEYSVLGLGNQTSIGTNQPTLSVHV